MRLKVRILLPLIVSSLGCYSYAPTTVDAVPEGAEVRALVTLERQAALRDQVGLNEEAVKGRVVEKRPDRLLLSVRTASTAEEFGSRSLYQRVEIPQADVLRVDAREVSPLKTAGIVAVTSGGIVVILLEVLGGESVSGGGNGGDGGQDRVTGWLPSVPVLPF
jgi:hypothetical protein